jgi:hypothetical protein
MSNNLAEAAIRFIEEPCEINDTNNGIKFKKKSISQAVDQTLLDFLFLFLFFLPFIKARIIL